MELNGIIKGLRSYEGFTRKKGIGPLINNIKEVSDFGNTVIGPGDDAAAIREGDSFLLLAADGIWEKLVKANPYSAGRASVIVNVNDIYAMGGKPVAMVNIISSLESYDLEKLISGITDTCRLYGVPMVGGHLHPDSGSAELSVAIAGRANKLLTSHTAKSGQHIIAAIDLDGKKGDDSIYSFNSVSHKKTLQINENLEIMVRIAEEEISDTAKDISNPGIIGTIAMLCSSSNCGADLNLDEIPRPPGFDLNNWLKTYPSYGFIICTDNEKTKTCLDKFEEKGINAAVIGKISDDQKIFLNYKDKTGLFLDLNKEGIY